ncbi:MAG: histidine kinase [Rikenellaceae bacterium]
MKKISANRKTNWKIALIFSAFLSAFNLLNNSQYYSDTNFSSIVLSWCGTFLFLFVSWYAISFLTKFLEKSTRNISLIEKILIMVVCTATLLAIFFIVGVIVRKELSGLVPRKDNVHFFIVLRGFVSIFIIYIFQYALNSDAKTREISLQNQMLKTENIRTQFEILRQQMNPHFLFNSLSTLRSMIRSNNKNSEIFVIKLSEIYRQLLLKREKEIVPLHEELDFVNDYSFMLLSRFEKMLSIEIDIQKELMHLKIPTFSLQLILENCIKHNVISREKPLSIKIFNTSAESITVENNFQPKLSQTEQSGFGLQNLVKRYTLLGYPDGVCVFSDDTVFRIKLKLLEV